MANIKIIRCWNCNTEVPAQIYNNLTTIPTCKKCGVFYPEKPKLEAELTLSQDAYLQNRTQENLNKLFKPMNQLVFNLICHKLKNSSTRLSKEEIDEKVQWTLEKLLSYYIQKPYFKISGSFTSYISKVILYPLYNKKEQQADEMEISLSTTVGKNENGREKTLLDMIGETDGFGQISDAESELINECQKSIVVDESVAFVETAINVLFNVKRKQNDRAFMNSLMFALLYKYFICNKNERYFMEVFKTLPIDLRDNFEKSKELFKEKLISLSYA